MVLTITSVVRIGSAKSVVTKNLQVGTLKTQLVTLIVISKKLNRLKNIGK